MPFKFQLGANRVIQVGIWSRSSPCHSWFLPFLYKHIIYQGCWHFQNNHYYHHCNAPDYINDNCYCRDMRRGSLECAGLEGIHKKYALYRIFSECKVIYVFLQRRNTDSLGSTGDGIWRARRSKCKFCVCFYNTFVLWGCFHVLLFTVIHFDKTFVVWRWFLCFFSSRNICGILGDSGWSNSPFRRWASLNQWWTTSSWDKGVITRKLWCVGLVG